MPQIPLALAGCSSPGGGGGKRQHTLHAGVEHPSIPVLPLLDNLQFLLQSLPPEFLSGRDDLRGAVALTQDAGSPLHT